MAVESKPLFHPEVLRQQTRSFSLPEQTAAWQSKLQQWAILISSGRAVELKETALLPDFLTDIFCGLLGYTGPAKSLDTRTIEPARARAAETLKLESTLSDLVSQAYALTPAEIELMWHTAPPRMPIPLPFPSSGMPEPIQS
jgi:hypothetical protein